MAAIHLDKDGRMGSSNVVASVYGKNDFEKFIEKERVAGRVLYENKKMGLDELPASGLQLSGVEATSDPMFNIPQNVDNANSISKENTKEALISAYTLATKEQKNLNNILSDVSKELELNYTPTTQKSIKSMSDKVQRKNTSTSPYSVMDMKDHARGKLDLNDFNQIPDVLKAFDKRGIPYSTEAIHTEWGYKGFHVTYRNADGIGSEVQLTRPDVWKIKLQSDAIYEKWRNVIDATQLNRTQFEQYSKDMERSILMWNQLELPDFKSFSSSSLLNTRALNNSSIGNGERAALHAPSKNSLIGYEDWSMIRPDSVKQAMVSTPFNNNSIQQNIGTVNKAKPLTEISLLEYILYTKG